MRILVVGSGGREHALCWTIAASPLCTKLFCAPGNAGIAEVAECIAVGAEDIAGQVALAEREKIDFVVVGPEGPLVAGLADRLAKAGIKVFGPSARAAQLEGSKGFTKDLCRRHNIPTAAYERFTDAARAEAYVRAQGVPIVVKADGLAAGKGVVVAETMQQAVDAIHDMLSGDRFGTAGASVVIEEFMEGEEASLFALCDGEHALALAGAQDYKRAFDGDKGPNTGGMGAYSPAPILDEAMIERAMREIVLPTVRGLKAEAMPYKGVLYAGLMIGRKGPRLVEYNCRFGDPECQVLMRLQSDLPGLCEAALAGRLDAVRAEWDPRAALGVVLTAADYPDGVSKGEVISGLDRAARLPGKVFHAATTTNQQGQVVTNGGRILCAVGLGRDVGAAQKQAYALVDAIEWPGMRYRRDIGYRAVAREAR
ncbi:phosphoribosylamine--glycine ligase, partial [Reyranella sp.]|uniref:phosphoribosylamine--glycine ligase n=1 Tax=Reyranella sp. TaxID=1929291 RepID=UPI002F930400